MAHLRSPVAVARGCVFAQVRARGVVTVLALARGHARDPLRQRILMSEANRVVEKELTRWAKAVGLELLASVRGGGAAEPRSRTTHDGAVRAGPRRLRAVGEP